MYICELCNYTTSSNNSIQRHNKTIKHLNNLTNLDNVIKKSNKICESCNKEFTFINNFYRHRKTCKSNQEILESVKEQEYKLEIEKLKNKLTKKNLKIQIIIN
jgi:hypothetical protein